MQRRLVIGLSALTAAAVAGPATAAWVVPAAGGGARATAASLAAPTGLAATAVGTTAVDVVFTPASGQPSGTLTRVLRDTPVAGSTVVCTQTAPPCHDTGLAAGTTYSYTAQTVLGPWSQPAAGGASATTRRALAVTTSALAGATVGTPYSQALTASGGTAPYTWSITAGSLPAGLTLTSAGQISGTPSTAGSAGFSVQVRDASGQLASAQLSITTAAAQPATATRIVLTAPAAWVAGAAQHVTLTAQTSGGATDTSFTGSRAVVWSGAAYSASPNGTNASAPGSVTFSGGRATVPVTLVRAASTQVALIATVGTLTAGSADVTVAAAPALAFTRQPNSGQAGKELNPAPTVSVQEPYGNAVAGPTTVTLAIASGPAGATLNGGNAQVSNGVATFGSLSVSAAGTYTLTASGTGVASVTSAPISVG